MEQCCHHLDNVVIVDFCACNGCLPCAVWLVMMSARGFYVDLGWNLSLCSNYNAVRPMTPQKLGMAIAVANMPAKCCDVMI